MMSIARQQADAKDNEASGTSMVFPHRTFYSNGHYSEYAFLFAVESGASYIVGVHYDAKWTISVSTFPSGSFAEWFVPEGIPPHPFGVWGYVGLAFGNYDGGQSQVPVTPLQVCDLTSFKSSFDWTYAGSTAFNLLTELWLTKDAHPVEGHSGGNALYEVGFLLHVSELAFHESGQLIGYFNDNEVEYTARLHGSYITLLPSSLDLFSGTINWKAALDFLSAKGIISGLEWVNGLAFGAEPCGKPRGGSHGGKLIVKQWSVDFQGST